MEEQPNNGPSDDNLQGHNSELINEKFSDAPENQPDTEGVLDADKAAAPSYELHTDNQSTPEIGQQTASAGPDTAKIRSSGEAGADETANLDEESGGTADLSAE